MAVLKCSVCDQRKVQRSCPALGKGICSLCCGTKRGQEIECAPSCPHLGLAVAIQTEKAIARAVAEAFPTQDHDVFRIPAVVEFVEPIERTFVERLYPDRSVNDLQIRDALWKVYLFFSGQTDVLTPSTPVEGVVFDVCATANAACPDLDAVLKAKAVLRILRAIQKASGGIFGDRNYLEMIYSMFSGAGKWSHMFGWDE